MTFLVKKKKSSSRGHLNMNGGRVEGTWAGDQEQHARNNNKNKVEKKIPKAGQVIFIIEQTRPAASKKKKYLFFSLSLSFSLSSSFFSFSLSLLGNWLLLLSLSLFFFSIRSINHAAFLPARWSLLPSLRASFIQSWETKQLSSSYFLSLSAVQLNFFKKNIFEKSRSTFGVYKSRMLNCGKEKKRDKRERKTRFFFSFSLLLLLFFVVLCKLLTESTGKGRERS